MGLDYICLMHHETYMKRCFQLANLGLGNVSPNPLVGAVVVNENEVIGEGYHQYFGGPHAEVNALQHLHEDSRLKSSTIYVNLEPCAHFGKTPPCADLILRLGIPRVVISNRDPFDLVNGAGLERLKSHGVEVVTGVLEEEGRFLNRRFFTFHEQKRPYIILKWAQSADGFLDKPRSSNEAHINWITTPASRRLVHMWRSEEPAILVGLNTVINDNPSLTVREISGKSPLRIVLGDCARIPKTAAVLNGQSPTLLIHTGAKAIVSSTNIEVVHISTEQNVLPTLMNILHEKNIQSLIVEGGAQVLSSFLDADLWDEARVFQGVGHFNAGVKAPQLSVLPNSISTVSEDTLRVYYRNL
jgi:diaminohydroxyphosphoribosylaminopyrimidine deaminase/5-amino-6-(5-phosphoribosylamino)uracil reductase